MAILLEWKRRALAEGVQLAFENVPPTMASLAELYGVDELLSLRLKRSSHASADDHERRRTPGAMRPDGGSAAR